MEGVFIAQLRCPTCGGLFHREAQREGEDDPVYGPIDRPGTRIAAPGRVFLVCQQDHRWTVRMVERVSDGEGEVGDYIALGEYIGGGDLVGQPTGS